MRYSVLAGWMIRNAELHFDEQTGEVDTIALCEEWEHIYGLGQHIEALATAEQVAVIYQARLLRRAS